MSEAHRQCYPCSPFYSFFSKCCDFHIISFPDWTTKDRSVVCIYCVRAYTKSWCGRMQLLAFFYQIMRLVCCEINQKFKKTTAQCCFSILKSSSLCVVSQINIQTQCKLPGKAQLLRLLCDGGSGTYRCVTVGTGRQVRAALWKTVSFQVYPRLKNHPWVGSTVDCLNAKMDHKRDYFKRCVRICRMFWTLSTANLGIKGRHQGEKLDFIHLEHYDDRDSSNNLCDVWKSAFWRGES